jgi:hypothetical protein
MAGSALSRPAIAAGRNCYIPRLTALEARDVPSICVVNNLGDTGAGAGSAGDLRYCMDRSNRQAGKDQILFSVQGTINLTQALPEITDDLTIAGPGADRLTVRRDTGGSYRIFTNLATTELSGITVTNGWSNYGGGISNGYTKTLTLSDCVITANRTGGTNAPVYGGGIYNSGYLKLQRALVSRNKADTASFEGYGGGIYNAGHIDARYSTIADNAAIGASCLFACSSGGGIYDQESMYVYQSTIAGNTVQSTQGWTAGAGLYIARLALLFNSTVSGNSGAYFGGGMSTGAAYGITNETLIYYSTFADNQAAYGGGIAIANGQGTIQTDVGDTVVAGNLASSGPDLYGALSYPDFGYNLFSKSSGGYGYVQTDLLNVDAKLGPLQDNGGPTWTHALLPGSPAIDSGSSTNLLTPSFDQRGPGFDRIVNGKVDRGAFEVQNTGGPAGGRSSVLVTAARPALAKTGVLQPAPAEAPHRQTVPTTALPAVPGAVGKLAAPTFHAGHLPAPVPDSDADPLALGW